MNSLVIIPLLLTAMLFSADPAAEPPLPRLRPAAWAQPMIGGPGNFCKVSDEVYRCEQPTDDEMALLARFGLKSVLNLREYHTDDDEAAGTTLKLYRIKMDAAEIKDAEIAQAVKILREAPKPVLVHCWHGSDRTGVVIAMYRMAIQGWSRDDAIDEFKHGGFGYHATWYPNIETYLRTVDLAQFK
jgi:protein tyrosine phosphatase (PTP) superfamily phosphohydrolase (DUF442 family)